MSISYDGHVHSPFCPHGTTDQLEEYVEEAITFGYKGMTFTEHAPLPQNFNDPVPNKDSGMSEKNLNEYLKAVHQLKSTYAGKIEIRCGLEIDYIEGFEDETKHFLQRVGPQLDDAILSVHFIKHGDQYTCLDYSPTAFKELVDSLGSIESVHQKYYDTVLKSVHADLGIYKPRRIGHITLANKFQKEFPFESRFQAEISSLLDEVKNHGYSLDYNGAGTVKPLCGEPYPPDWVIKEAINREIPLVYGSDAHSAKGIGQGTEMIMTQTLSSPYRVSRS
ncbi:histidinol-phosphatase HisJ [Guptibacillus hwajinpoensis]|uniref:Histidinol-phosphatase n=1 Tax=Guptibacillus hwajinpoensis TaxID=208199 RepID=A0A0J6CZB3_9BACL|nr:histidinol-phosphatase HisJ [Alkalihalobacillus macyae]KMM37374.1 histidinol phosphatase [Alkalihalobacillus macyae]